MDQETKDFTAFLQKFYDHGFLREVYRSERAIVCNAYNQFYIAIDRKFLARHSEKYGENIPCFVMNSNGLKEIVKDDAFVKAYYLSLSEEKQNDALRFLTEGQFQSWLKRDSELRQKKTPEHMDLEFEAQLLEKGVDAVRSQLLEEAAKRVDDAQKEKAKSRKRGLFCFFKRK